MWERYNVDMAAASPSPDIAPPDAVEFALSALHVYLIINAAPIYAYRIWKADTYSCRNERQLGYIFVCLINIGRGRDFLDPALHLSSESHST